MPIEECLEIASYTFLHQTFLGDPTRPPRQYAMLRTYSCLVSTLKKSFPFNP
jgi:hypothetical protein